MSDEQKTLDEILEDLKEAQARINELGMNSQLGLAPDDPEGLHTSEAIVTGQLQAAQQAVDETLNQHRGGIRVEPEKKRLKQYCERCGHIDSHSSNCPDGTPAVEDVVAVDLPKPKPEPSIRRELKRIAVGFLRKVANRLSDDA